MKTTEAKPLEAWDVYRLKVKNFFQYFCSDILIIWETLA